MYGKVYTLCSTGNNPAILLQVSLHVLYLVYFKLGVLYVVNIASHPPKFPRIYSHLEFIVHLPKCQSLGLGKLKLNDHDGDERCPEEDPARLP